MSFVSELKRRKVFQVAAVYLVVAWLIMQVVDVVNEPLRLPEWFATGGECGRGVGKPNVCFRLPFPEGCLFFLGPLDPPAVHIGAG